MLSRKKIKELLQAELSTRDEGVSLTEGELEEFVGNYSGDDRIVRFSEIEVTPATPFPTGFDELDDILGGFFTEQVITLTAFPKHGKTSFVLDIARNVGEEKCLFLSLEQSPEDIKRQWVEQGLEIPDVYVPFKTHESLTKVDWIEWKIIEAQYRSKKEYGEAVTGVFIDHFGYIDWEKEMGENAADAIRRVMRELKKLASRTNTFIVVIVHVNKDDETQPPTTQDLQGSSGYHQVSDSIISLWRETYKDGKQTKKTENVLLQVLANRRRGDVGSAKYVYKDGHFIKENWMGWDERQKYEETLAEQKFEHGF